MLMTDLSREGFGRPPQVTPNSFYESGVFLFARKFNDFAGQAGHG
jgi:hypothetical protein